MLTYISCFGFVLILATNAALLPPRDSSCDIMMECETPMCIEQMFRILPHCKEIIDSDEPMDKRTPLMNTKRHNRVKEIFVKSYMNRIG